VFLGGYLQKAIDWILNTYVMKEIVGLFEDSENDTTLTIVNSTQYDWDSFYDPHRMVDFGESVPLILPTGCTVVCPIRFVKDGWLTDMMSYPDPDGHTPYAKVYFYFGPETVTFNLRWQDMKATLSCDTLQYRCEESFDMANTDVAKDFNSYLLVVSGTENNNYQMYSKSPLISIMSTKHQGWYLGLLCYLFYPN